MPDKEWRTGKLEQQTGFRVGGVARVDGVYRERSIAALTCSIGAYRFESLLFEFQDIGKELTRVALM